jgi:hypothetical protein
MKPIKNFEPVAKWILRIAVVAYIIFKFKGRLSHFEIKNIDHILAAVYMLFAALLLFGGFSKNAGLSVISGIVIAIVSAVQIFFHLRGGFSLYALTNTVVYLYLMLFAAGLFFAAKGNS